MFGSRRGRPSLIGRAAQTAARTAVIAGTATAVSGKVAARQAGAAPPAARRRSPGRPRRRPPPAARAASATRPSPACRSSPSCTPPASSPPRSSPSRRRASSPELDPSREVCEHPANIMLQTRHAPAASELALAPGVALARARAHEAAGPARAVFALLAAARLAGPVLWLQPGLVRRAAARRRPPRLPRPRPPRLRPRRASPPRPSGPPRRRCASGEVPLVVADLPAPPALTAVRRLHLAAESRRPPRPRTRRSRSSSPPAPAGRRASRPAGASPPPPAGRGTAPRAGASPAPAPAWRRRRAGRPGSRTASSASPRHDARPSSARREAHLPAYAAALGRGWSPDTMRPEVGRGAARAHRRGRRRLPRRPRGREPARRHRHPARRQPGPAAALASCRWMWDGELAGSINLRWPAGGDADAAARPRPHRLRRRPLEAPPRLRHPRPRAPPARSAGARPRLRRAHHRAREPRLATGDREERRQSSSSASRRPPPTAAAPRSRYRIAL